MASKDWWFGESSLWGELTGKKARGEAKRAQQQAQAASARNLSLARTQLERLPTYTPGRYAEGFEVPEAIQRRMSIIKGRAGEATTEQVQRSLGELSRSGMLTSGAGQALAADIRRRGGRQIGEQVAGLEMAELEKAEAERYRQFLSEVQKQQALANLYKTQAGIEADIYGRQLPQTREGEVGLGILTEAIREYRRPTAKKTK